jgi:hypothetical protein
MRVLALAMALMLFAGACGGGDDDEANEGAGAAATEAGETPEETAHAEHTAFCEGVVAAETAVLAASSGGDPGDLEGLLATLEETAPPELEEQLTVVLDTVRRALDKKDDSVFENEEFATNEEEVDAWLADNCGFEAVDISAVEYAFEGAPETLTAGTTTFTFTNDGEEVHEMIMVRYKDESLTIKDLMKLSDKEAEKQLEFLGASFGPPGTVDTESRSLAAGKYALVCFIPVGATSEKALRKAEGPPHVAKGMSAEFIVQ